jgi:NAD+ diphosphatase
VEPGALLESAAIVFTGAAGMAQERPNFFSGPYIERRSEEREDPQWLAAARADPNTQYLVGQGTTQLLRSDGEPHPALLANEAALLARVAPENFVLLGWYRGARCLLADVPEGVSISPPPGTQLQELRPLTAVLGAEEAGLLAYARALSIWRTRHHHCGVCGSPTAPTHAGHCLRCTNPACASEFFPRIDPAIIVLVSDGERALLGRQSSWPARRYSTIAGFVEPGESLEDAVAREVEEETGVSVANVRYHSSQPWPFPSSVMLGFKARAERGAPVRLGGELEDARWFTRSQLNSAEALAPPTQSISWRLIESWLKGEE